MTITRTGTVKAPRTSAMKRTGMAAAAAGVLMTLGTQGEWLLDPQADDGTVTDAPVFVLLLTAATAGFVLLVLAVHGLRAMTGTTRTARVGSLISLIGAALLVGFGLVTIVSTLTSGQPLEAAFVAFLIGMLLLALGPIIWAIGLRRPSPVRWLRAALAIAGVTALVALAIEPDPWHDIALVAMFASWTAMGLMVIAASARSMLSDTRRGGAVS